MSSPNGTLGAMIWKLIERGGSQAVSLVVQIILARLLSPNDFGLLAVIIVFVNVGNVLVQSGLNMALVQADTVEEGDYSGVFFTSLSISIFLYLLLFLSAPQIEAFYNLSGMALYLRVLGLMLVINSFSCVQIAYLTRNMYFSDLCRFTLLASVLSGAIGILIAFAGGGLWSLIVQQISNQLIFSISLRMIVPWKPRFDFEVLRIKKLFSFGWKVCVSNCVNALYQNAYDLVIGKMFSASVLGYFSQGRKYPNALGTVFDEAIQAVMLPTLARKQNDRAALKESLRKSLSVELCFIAPLMLFVAMYAEEIVRVLLTDKWLPSVPFIRVFCIGYIFAPLSSNNLQALYALGRSDIVLKLEFVKKTIGLVLLAVTAVGLHDVFVVACGAVVYNMIVVVVNSFPNARLLNYGALSQIKDYGIPLAASFGSCAASLFLSFLFGPGVHRVIIKGVTFICFYIALIAFLKPLGWKYAMDKISDFRSR